MHVRISCPLFVVYVGRLKREAGQRSTECCSSEYHPWWVLLRTFDILALQIESCVPFTALPGKHTSRECSNWCTYHRIRATFDKVSPVDCIAYFLLLMGILYYSWTKYFKPFHVSSRLKSLFWLVYCFGSLHNTSWHVKMRLDNVETGH